MAIEGIVGLFLLLLLDGAGGDEPVAMGVEVPGVTGVGGAANLTCHHHLPTAHLYTLKWYHNDSEFYRYVPSDAHSPVFTRSVVQFKAQEAWRGERGVTLTLSSLTSSASGEYKCEVIAEHPSFRTETRAASMRVAGEERGNHTCKYWTSSARV
ncbi:uncharacterized protein LOC135096041 [Scylla paramamosain]|uniref:uncharacterized protein LOC135096041 n=1 Tax=Scylla paramamosain TaxID=85552 RepID=UPI003083781E